MSPPDPPFAGESPFPPVKAPGPAEAGASAPTRPPAPRWFVRLALAALAGYTMFLAANMSAVAGGSDSSGYLNSARLFAAGKVRAALRVPSEFAGLELKRSHFSPAGFCSFSGHRDLAPAYPSGFPLHLALGGRLLGWQIGPFVVQLLAAVAAVWLCYRTARALGLHFGLAGAAAAMLAVFPVFIYASVQTLSDTLATTWALAALFFALRGRASHRWAVACGAALAIAVLVRPTNALLAPALVVVLGFDVRRLGCFILGGVPGALWLGLYNHYLYGGALRSGYGDIFTDFALEYGAPTALHFAKWLALFLPPVVLALPLAALADRRTRGRELLGLGLVTVAIVGLYLFCAYSHDDWTYLRYILPALPALILGALLGVEAMARGPGARWPRAFRPVVALVLTLWALGNSWYWTRSLHALYVPGYERAYAEAARLVRERVPPNALILSCNVSGSIYYYTDLPTLLFDSVEPAEFARYEALARKAGRPIYAALFDIEEEDAIRKRCPGAWKKIAAAGNIGIWRLE